MESGKDNRRADKFAKSKQYHLKKTQTKQKAQKAQNSQKHLKNQKTYNLGTDKIGLKEIASETLYIIESGYYLLNNHEIVIREQLEESKRGTITYHPSYLPVENEIRQIKDTAISVKQGTTLNIARLESENSNVKIGILNFASAKNPGGGFLKGSNAQEESIARSSGLYNCIQDSSMYIVNTENNRKCLYNHNLIYSPGVPVFRNDDNELISPYMVDILTVPAVNAKQAALKRVPVETIEKTMIERMDNMFSVAVDKNIDVLILGAWGCGVFGGDFNFISYNFLKFLKNKYSGCFSKVVFALLSEEDIQILNKNLEHFKLI